MKQAVIGIAMLFTLCCGQAAIAQDRQAPPAADPVGEQLFPPELILQHQMAIGLTDPQRTALVAEVRRVQGEVIGQQAELQRGVERLIQLLKPDRVDEQAALAQLDAVLAAEREVKRRHISLAVRLKNLLTPEQLRQLRELRAASPGMRQ